MPFENNPETLFLSVTRPSKLETLATYKKNPNTYFYYLSKVRNLESFEEHKNEVIDLLLLLLLLLLSSLETSFFHHCISADCMKISSPPESLKR